MAFSSTLVKTEFVGQIKMKFYQLDFDSVTTSGDVDTGLSNIFYANFVNQATDDHGIMYINSASASATQDDPGHYYIDSVSSGDTGQLIVFGY